MAKDTKKDAKKDWIKRELLPLSWMGLLILFIRGFVVEPFQIPSGSMIPTLLEGDRLFVAKGSYDIRFPFTNFSMIKVANPKRGDVVVFEYPNYEHDESKEGLYYIKRIVGIPGDEIQIRGGVPYISGSPVPQTPLDHNELQSLLPNFTPDPLSSVYREVLPGMRSRGHWVQRYEQALENLPASRVELQSRLGDSYKECWQTGTVYKLQNVLQRFVAMNDQCSFKVPENSYFVMGDNRDDSADGREWGFVERPRLRGRALFIWASKEPDALKFRIARFGLRIL